MIEAAKRLRGQQAYLTGLAAESSVVADYTARDYTLVAQRWRSNAGEIDLIFETSDETVFVEVKAARTFDQARRALGKDQIVRIGLAAEIYMGTVWPDIVRNWRFDLALVDRMGRVEIVGNPIH